MKTIELTQGKLAVVDDADYESVSKLKWSATARKCGIWYAAGWDKGHIFLQNFLMRPQTGIVDHVDGNGLNNVRDNLRYATYSQNMMNRSALGNNKSGYKGVYWCSREGRWIAQICYQSIRHSLGQYTNVVDAARAYNKAAKEYHGDFAVLNEV